MSNVMLSSVDKKPMSILNWRHPDEDLPKTNEQVIVITETKSGRIGWNRAYWDGTFWHGSGSMANVIAWAEIASDLNRFAGDLILKFCGK